MNHPAKRIIANISATLLGLLLPMTSWGVEGIVTNSDGRSFEGTMRVDRKGILHLEVAADQGLVSYTFTKDTLRGIEFLDAEAVEVGLDAFAQEEHEVVISYLETIHRSRSPFYRLLAIKSLAEPSLALGQSYLAVGRYADATGVAGVLLGNEFSDPHIYEVANEMQLRAFFGLERWDESEILAKRWCAEQEPYDESALGWWILSEVHLARGEIEEARWISLQPITFSSQFPKLYLQDCFHVAIASWLEESPEQAWKLYQQYQKRGYIWPDESHPEVKLKLAALGLKLETPEEETDAPLTIEKGNPKKDLNLPLEKVRKLTTETESKSHS